MKAKNAFSFGKAKIPKVEVYRDEDPEIEVYTKDNSDFSKSKPAISKKLKRRIKTIFFIMVAALIVYLLFSLVNSRSPLDNQIDSFISDNDYDEFLVRKIAGAEINIIVSQLNSSCQNSTETSAFVSVMNSRKTNGTIVVVSDNAGNKICSFVQMPVSQNQLVLREDTLLATVNGNPIYGAAILPVLSAIPQEQVNEKTLSAALDQAINDALLAQEANKRNITAEPKDIEDEFNNFLKSNGLTLQALEQNLKNSGVTLNQFQDEVAARIVMRKLVAEITKEAVIPSDEDVRSYFDDNKNNITSLGKSTTRQLLIFANSTNAPEKLKAMEVIASSLNSTNFCDIVARYSDDIQTKNSCGLYESTQGQLLPEYEQEVYKSNPGDVKVISSRVGYHLVQILRVEPPKQASFEDAKQGIKEYLLNQNRQQILASYLKDLKNGANIVYS